MNFLWDTDTCIYHLNGNAHIKDKVKEVGARSICTTIVTIAELKFGAFNSNRIQKNLTRVETLQKKILVLMDCNDAIAEIFAKNKSILKSRGETIGDFDMLIASFALHHHMIVVTNNTAHFQRVPNLQIENWSA